MACVVDVKFSGFWLEEEGFADGAAEARPTEFPGGDLFHGEGDVGAIAGFAAAEGGGGGAVMAEDDGVDAAAVAGAAPTEDWGGAWLEAEGFEWFE